MKRFKIGTEYEAADPGVYTITIVSRSPKYLTVNNGGGMWRMRIRHDEDGNEMLIDSAVPKRARDMYTFKAIWEVR